MLRVTKILNTVVGVMSVVCSVIFAILGIVFLVSSNAIDPDFQFSAILVGWVFIALLFVFLLCGLASVGYSKKLNSAKSKEDLTGWSVVMIFLGFGIVGLLGLLISDDEFNQNTSSSSKVINATYVESDKDITTKLKTLKDLHDAGLITDSEYQEKRNKIVNSL